MVAKHKKSIRSWKHLGAPISWNHQGNIFALILRRKWHQMANGTLGPLFDPKWLEMANYERRRPFWAQRDLDGKWDWFWYFLCVIWIEWDSYYFFWSSIVENRLKRPIFWSTLTKNADLGAYLANSGSNILTFFRNSTTSCTSIYGCVPPISDLWKILNFKILANFGYF